ncbi:type I glyceraldehyde-3-phosphate dehydrogenase [Patescibacteria group bacterium]|nr:type I glyceraldehyde-3-phosphate dehydrogenase [Patescibacteria group bacterium]
MPIKFAINGFGRIGRPTFKVAIENPDIDIVAINDLTDNKMLAHLLKYDTNYGTLDKTVEAQDDKLIVDGKEYHAFSEPDPAKLPWKELGVDVVLECTGVFRKYEDAKKHLDAGAKLVIISAPGKGGPIKTFVRGVNDNEFDPKENTVIDNASCTTNSIAPVIKVLQESVGIEKAFLTTIHSYTADQNLVDGPHKKDLRRARAAAVNLIPTSTGAATATCDVVNGIEPAVFDGLSIRVPTPVVSLSDVTAVTKEDVTVEKVNELIKNAAGTDEYKGIIRYTEEELVSSDIKGTTYSGVFDSKLTNVVGGNLLKVIIWYDNEWAYSVRLVDQAIEYGKKIVSGV